MQDTTNEIDALVDELKWGHPETRKKAAIKLGRIRDKRVLPHLINAIETDEYIYTRVSAIQSLLWIADQSIIDTLLKIVEVEKESLVRKTAIEGLGSLRAKNSLSRLEVSLSREKNHDIKVDLKIAIDKIRNA